MTKKFKTIISIALVCFSLKSFGQSKFSIDLFATPFIQKFGKTTVKESYLEHPNIIAEYIYRPSQEIGIVFNQSFKNRFGWNIGVSWNNDYRSFRLSSTYDILRPNSYNLFLLSKDIKIQRIGGKFGSSYKLTKNIQLDFIISTFFNVHTKTTPESNTEFYIYYYPPKESNFHVQVYENSTIYKTQIIPEIKFSAQIWKGLRFHLGARLKFWGPFYMSTRIEGSFDTIDYTDNVLHRSFMSGGDMSYFSGLTYRFGLNKTEHNNIYSQQGAQ